MNNPSSMADRREESPKYLDYINSLSPVVFEEDEYPFKWTYDDVSIQWDGFRGAWALKYHDVKELYPNLNSLLETVQILFRESPIR